MDAANTSCLNLTCPKTSTGKYGNYCSRSCHMSEVNRKRWRNPEFRESQPQRISERNKGHIPSQAQRDAARRNIMKYHADPECAASHREKARETMTKNHKDPDFTKKLYSPRVNMQRVITAGHNRWRGLQYKFPHHWSSFTNMHSRSDEVDEEFSNCTRGFIAYIRYLGKVPDGMLKPTAGRRDHSIGYLRGNFEWQSHHDNITEALDRRYRRAST